jgi:hypothetical protein
MMNGAVRSCSWVSSTTHKGRRGTTWRRRMPDYRPTTNRYFPPFACSAIATNRYFPPFACSAIALTRLIDGNSCRLVCLIPSS